MIQVVGILTLYLLHLIFLNLCDRAPLLDCHNREGPQLMISRTPHRIPGDGRKGESPMTIAAIVWLLCLAYFLCCAEGAKVMEC